LKELALEITKSHETVYDKAQAITSYLRDEIEYQTTLEDMPPENLDPVMWVLFDYKKGFCMYYASAETLLLRSIGIPARIAVGFVEGAYDETTREYDVASKDSHAWTEVYFPGIGWVEFEPTSNQFPIERPEIKDASNELVPELDTEGNATATPLSPVPLQERPKPLSDEETDTTPVTGQTTQYSTFIILALILLMLGGGVFVVRHYSLSDRLPVYLTYQYERRGNTPPHWVKNWLRWTTLSSIERAFQSVNLSLRWLGQPQSMHITPQERAEVLIKLLPEAEEQTLSLLQEYNNTIFTPRKGNLVNARKAAAGIIFKTWQALIRETLQSADSRYNELK
jgi:hypothetical protein